MSQTRDKIVELLEDPEIEDPKAMADRIIAIVQGTNPPPIPQYGEPRNRRLTQDEFIPSAEVYRNVRNVEDIVCNTSLSQFVYESSDRQQAVSIARANIARQIANHLLDNNFIEITMYESANIFDGIQMRGRVRAVRF
jgi:hypothetical protein